MGKTNSSYLNPTQSSQGKQFLKKKSTNLNSTSKSNLSRSKSPRDIVLKHEKSKSNIMNINIKQRKVET